MTSEERREARYRRRVAKRAEHKRRYYSVCDDFDTVFSYDHLYQSYKKCRRNVAWKSSTQRYISQAPLNVFNTYCKLKNGTFKSAGFYEFDLMERGKKRHIRSVNIDERVVQRCLCDYSLVPVLKRTFIYDNGSSLENKGYSFAIKRLSQHLREHYRRHGTEGYILLFDFSKFFDRVSHKLIKKILANEYTDERLLSILHYFVDAFGDVGLGLGSQISQTLALASANRLDHFVKEICHIRGYGRYMDDGYLIHHSKEYLHHCLSMIKTICNKLEITLNVKKTQIVKLSHGFTWLKVRFFLLESGRVVRKVYRGSVIRMRRKLKSFHRLVQEEKMSQDDIYTSWQSWRSYANRFDAHRTIESLGRLYNQLFIQEWQNHSSERNIVN